MKRSRGRYGCYAITHVTKTRSLLLLYKTLYMAQDILSYKS
jgi:hypothetical protein